MIAESVGAGLLIAVTYGALGIALGTLRRSAAGGVAAALAWYFLIDVDLSDLSTDAGPVVQHIYNAFPEASVTTLYFMFGTPGSLGGASATYQPVAHHAAVAIMLGYTAVFVALALVRRRDIVTAGAARLPLALVPAAPYPGGRRAAGRRERRLRYGCGGLGRAEPLVMCRWPAMRALILVLPAFTLFDGYLEPYVLYRAGTSSVSGNSPSQVLPAILPGQYLPAVQHRLQQ